MGISVPDKLKELVDHFDNNLSQLKSQQYNETQARREFIDPLFTLLGWDVDNRQGYAEAYKDVIHEDAIKVGGFTKAPDYCFRIGGTRKFFVEAKKPGVNIKENTEPAYQLRRYAWSSKLPLSILTDFEEFAVYDCRTKPNPIDKSSNGRVKYLNYADYINEWDYLISTFSREAVLKGSFDKYVESNKAKKGTAEVDKAFLLEIESWRETLARNIAIRNENLTTRDLNFAVQATIDRIIFLRICEDRSVEDYGRLMALQNGEGVYQRLTKLFRDADEKYNSGLFHFEPEKGRETPDTLTPNLKIDDKVIKDLLKSIYYPESPYEFSVLPADILGQVYEQFLGKVIRLTAGHQAKVEDKPEVKKAGGVYYTPTYIVDYIVKNTVGKILEGKTPAEISKADHPVRILDPACGSGSFLLGAYEYLLTWYRDEYVKAGPEKHIKGKEPKLYQSEGGAWKLTTSERKRILLNHIYGVDIDSQAVEVTKLSLLLKVLEGETKDSVSTQRRLFNERALPDLSKNIKCGNSLIGSDFYKDKQLDLFNEEERIRINAFDWEEEFKEVFKDGGFDAVIGNPPYGAWFDENESDYFKSKYRVFSGIKDVYPCFMEQSINALNEKGKLSFIVPSAWLGGPGYKNLRQIILPLTVEKILLLPFDVFKDAYVDTTVFVLSKLPSKMEHRVHTFTYPKRSKLTSIDLGDQQYERIEQERWKKTEDGKFITNMGAVQLLNKITHQMPVTLTTIIDIKRGVLFDKSLLTTDRSSHESYPYFEGDVYRYQFHEECPSWIEFNDQMKERPKEIKWFQNERVLLRRLVNRQQRLMATLVSDAFITNKNLYSVLSKNDRVNIKVILGILNSKLVSYLYINQVTQATKDDFPQVTIKDFLNLPCPELSEDTPLHDKMVSLVSSMLSLHKQLQSANTEQDRTIIQRQINVTDKEIDRLVYELYELTPDEIKIVEAK